MPGRAVTILAGRQRNKAYAIVTSTLSDPPGDRVDLQTTGETFAGREAVLLTHREIIVRAGGIGGGAAIAARRRTFGGRTGNNPRVDLDKWSARQTQCADEGHDDGAGIDLGGLVGRPRVTGAFVPPLPACEPDDERDGARFAASATCSAQPFVRPSGRTGGGCTR